MSKNNLVVGVFALQGCVLPHKFHIEALGAKFKEVRTIADFHAIDALILPGGESTTMLKLIHEFNLEETMHTTFKRVPVWGICAGAILMAKTVLSPAQRSFGLLNATIQRNAYGSQLESFNATIENSLVSFIRAPIIRDLGPNVIIKSEFENTPVWIQEGPYMATTFHPELTTGSPSNIHKYFISLLTKYDVNQIT